MKSSPPAWPIGPAFTSRGLRGYGAGAWWNFPVTVIWLVACTNAINLIDGVDGLATGVGLFATLTTLVAALLQGNIPSGARHRSASRLPARFYSLQFQSGQHLPGRLRKPVHRFPAGLLRGCLEPEGRHDSGSDGAADGAFHSSTRYGRGDLRRFLRRQPLFEGDQNHIHHRLLSRGFTPRKVSLVLYACAAAGAVCSLLVMNRNLSGFIILAFCMTTWIGVQHLGYVEFGVAGRLFIDGAFRRLLNSHISIENFESSLAAAATPEDCWNVLERCHREFGFYQIDVRMAGTEISGVRRGSAVSILESHRSAFVRQLHRVVARIRTCATASGGRAVRGRSAQGPRTQVFGLRTRSCVAGFLTRSGEPAVRVVEMPPPVKS